MSEKKKSIDFRFSMLMAIADIIKFFIFAKITKWRTFFDDFPFFATTKKTVKIKI